MPKVIRFDHRMKGVYMRIALEYAQASRATKRQVGAIIVRDYHQLAEGFNGTPPGLSNSCEDLDGVTLPGVIHGELNAILKLARHGVSGQGASMFTTLSPCEGCAGAAISVGIAEVYYMTRHKPPGLLMLQEAGIYIEHYPLQGQQERTYAWPSD